MVEIPYFLQGNLHFIFYDVIYVVKPLMLLQETGVTVADTERTKWRKRDG